MYHGQTVLITGGSSGIGKQLAADFLRLGAHVVICSRGPERVAAATAELMAISPHVTGLRCDVGDPGSVQEMAMQVLADHGCPDILVNNAGFATYRTFIGSQLEEIERLVSVNFLGALRCTKAFLPHMVSRRSGTIVNMSSIAGRLVMTPNGTYSAAKHGLVAWSEIIRYELAPYNIRVNVICPGRVETHFFDHETFKRRAPRREARYTITLEDVSRATLQAIQRDRSLTYVPWTLGLLVWLYNVFPFLVKPVYGRLLLHRLAALHS